MAKTLTKILAPVLLIPVLAFPSQSQAGPRGARQLGKALPGMFEQIFSAPFKAFENKLNQPNSQPQKPRKYTRMEEEMLEIERKKYQVESEKAYLEFFINAGEIDQELLAALKSRQRFEKQSVYDYYKQANQRATSFGKVLIYDITIGKHLPPNSYKSAFQKEVSRIKLERMIPWDVDWENPSTIEKTVIEQLSFYCDNFFEKLQTEKADKDSQYSKAKDFIRAINMPRIQANQERK